MSSSKSRNTRRASWPPRWETNRSVGSANGARHTGRDQGNRPGCSRVRPGGPNATVEASGNQRIGATAVDMKLEVVAVPVSDVDRAKDLYQSLGWRLDADFVTGPEFRVIQMNPARLGLRDHFRHGDHLGRARFGAGPHHPPAVHGKHEEEIPISSAQSCPSGAWSGRRRRRARRAHHYQYRARGSSFRRLAGDRQPSTLPNYRRHLH